MHELVQCVNYNRTGKEIETDLYIASTHLPECSQSLQEFKTYADETGVLELPTLEFMEKSIIIDPFMKRYTDFYPLCHIVLIQVFKSHLLTSNMLL